MKAKPLFVTCLLVACAFGLLVMSPLTFAQGGQGQPTPTPQVGTLVPPTPIIVATPTPTPQAAAVSGIRTLQDTGKIRVGVRYNVPPFSWLDDKGEVNGYEAELMQAIAVDLKVEVEFVQVTAETQRQALLSGQVDVLIGEQIHTRDGEQWMEYSHPYYYNEQRIVIRQGDPYGRIADLANHRVSVIAGSRGEEAMGLWMAQNGTGMELVRYLTQDDALDALANGEVDAMVGELDDLSRAGRQNMSLLGEVVRFDFYAIAFRRHDVNLRNPINRAIQRLYASGRVVEIAEKWFPDKDINFAALIPVYDNFAGDTREVKDFPPDIPSPNQSVMDKIRNGEAITVAGVSLNDTDPLYKRFLDPLNREIMYEMGRRWGVTIVFLPDTADTGVDLVANGQADIAVNVRPRWDGADRADYSLPYHYHKHQILVVKDGRYDGGINSFRGGSWIGYYEDTPADGERLEFLVDFLRISPAIYRFISNQQVIEEIFDQRNVDGIFADSIRLQALTIEQPRNAWAVLPNFEDLFGPIVMATPRNDADFLTLVNWTLADMYRDGTLASIWTANYPAVPLFPGQDVPPFVPDWAGVGDFLYQQAAE